MSELIIPEGIIKSLEGKLIKSNWSANA